MKALLDFLFPIYCVGCEQEGTHCCQECFVKILQYESASTEVPELIAACPFREKSSLAHLIHRLKYDGSAEVVEVLVPLFSQKLLLQLREIPQKVFVPVPLHWRRKSVRGFNQSLLIAQELKKLVGGSVRELIRRTRYTKPQVELSREERQLNVSGAFAFDGGALDAGELYPNPEATYILIDDVYTTGSTVNECADILKQMGSFKVLAVVIGKTVAM